MSAAIKVLGVVLVVGGVVVPLWLFARASGTVNHSSAVVTVSFLAVFAGVACLLMDRITELTLSGVGTIRAATDQVIADAKTVTDLKARVENQTATVDLIAA